jgi:hypothetical protein
VDFWIWILAVFAIYLFSSMFWGVRGAIVCFAAMPIIGLAFGLIFPPEMDFLGRKLDMVGKVFAIVAGAGWGSVFVWMVGFPAAAIGLALGPILKRQFRTR